MNSVQTNLGDTEQLFSSQQALVSPANGGKKPGKFSRMMNWVDRKLCGGGSGPAAQSDTQKPEEFKRTLTPEELAERKEQKAKAAKARDSDLS